VLAPVPSVPAPVMVAVYDSAVTDLAEAFKRATDIVAAATAASGVFDAVTTASVVADEVSPAFNTIVAEVATVLVLGFAVTVIVSVCAAALRTPPPPDTAGVNLTTYVPASVGPSMYTENLAEAATVVPAAATCAT